MRGKPKNFVVSKAEAKTAGKGGSLHVWLHASLAIPSRALILPYLSAIKNMKAFDQSGVFGPSQIGRTLSTYEVSHIFDEA
jgi:hypothetical protein